MSTSSSNCLISWSAKVTEVRESPCEPNTSVVLFPNGSRYLQQHKWSSYLCIFIFHFKPLPPITISILTDSASLFPALKPKKKMCLRESVMSASEWWCKFCVTGGFSVFYKSVYVPPRQAAMVRHLLKIYCCGVTTATWSSLCKIHTCRIRNVIRR